MREDWDRRARQDAEGFIYTRDADGDVPDFAQSGEANYHQLIRPFLPILLDGRPACACRVVEIGCGVGRMTACLAREFGLVDALDVSPVMIEAARRALAGWSNIAFHTGSGCDLAGVADGCADLVFSYIVFQHIPSRTAIESYVYESARVLRAGGAFKFQWNGDQSQSDPAHQPDTWLGESFAEREARDMLAGAGFSVLAMEGVGTQYFTVTARQGPLPAERPYVLPGEAWAAPHLLEGFGAAVDGSWRPMAGRARVRLAGAGKRLYLGLYFWPESCNHRLTVAGHEFVVSAAGDRYFECEGGQGEIELTLDPPPARPPAFRVIGLY